MKLNLRSIIMLVFWVSIPIYVHAHVKWFADIDPVKEPLEKILSPVFMSIALLIAVLLAALTQLLPALMKVQAFKRAEEYLAGLRKWSRYLLKYGTVFALVIQVVSGSILAPEFKLTTTTEIIWVWATIIVLAIPYHVATKVAALSILGLYLYVLSDVGLFHMLGNPEAVLIRALEPLIGEKLMFERRKVKQIKDLTNGPGKLTKAMGIDMSAYGHPMYTPPLYIANGITPVNISQGKRIGIDNAGEAKDYPWRFWITNNPFVSRHQNTIT